MPQTADCHRPGLTLVAGPQVPLSCCTLRQGDFVLPNKAPRPSHIGAGSWKVTRDTELAMGHRQHPDQDDNGKTVAKGKLFLNLVMKQPYVAAQARTTPPNAQVTRCRPRRVPKPADLHSTRAH